MKKFLLLLVPILVGGCVGAIHRREITEYRLQPDGTTNVVHTVEYTKMHSSLSTTALKGFKETTRDGTNGYARSVGVNDTTTDISAQIKDIAQSVAEGVAAGLAKGVKP